MHRAILLPGSARIARIASHAIEGQGILTIFRPLTICSAAGLVLAWLVDFWYFPNHPILPDEFRFLDAAAHLRATGEYLVQSMHAREMPLPAALFALLGPNLDLIRFVQAVAIPLQAWLVNDLGRRAFGPRVGRLAGCAAALYPFFLFYQGLALSETLFTLLLLCFVAALYRFAGRERQMPAVMAVGALATYAKASLTILPPLLLLPFARPRIVVLACVVYLACLAPWWVRNDVILRAFVPFTTTASMNLYVGNNARTVSGRGDWNTEVDPDEVARFESITDEVARSKAYSRAAETYIVDNPGRFIELCFIRLEAFWNVIPNTPLYRSALFVAVSALSSGPVLVFALIGLWTTRRAWRRLMPLYGLIVYFTALHTVTIASLRYRLPIEPYLILLACAGAISCYDWMRKMSWRSNPTPT